MFSAKRPIQSEVLDLRSLKKSRIGSSFIRLDYTNVTEIDNEVTNHLRPEKWALKICATLAQETLPDSGLKNVNSLRFFSLDSCKTT